VGLRQTFGGSVSRLPGSLVADVALRIGRAISGVYNKIMNFRHDPRDEREGMSGCLVLVELMRAYGASSSTKWAARCG
jgi:hypothetical protein